MTNDNDQRPTVYVCGVCNEKLASSAPHGDRGCIRQLLARIEILKTWADIHVDETDCLYTAIEARLQKIEESLED